MTATAPAPADTWIRRHRLSFYFALTCAISWPLWLLSRLAGGTLGTVLLVVGALGRCWQRRSPSATRATR
jgi:hypothetical protein